MHLIVECSDNCNMNSISQHYDVVMMSLNLWSMIFMAVITHKGADKSLARPTSWCILFDGENISFHASFVIYK